MPTVMLYWLKIDAVQAPLTVAAVPWRSVTATTAGGGKLQQLVAYVEDVSRSSRWVATMRSEGLQKASESVSRTVSRELINKEAIFVGCSP